jgi:lipopolysaccharide/colanic/teichoic acid biosynthesis glycosyltransferase
MYATAATLTAQAPTQRALRRTTGSLRLAMVPASHVVNSAAKRALDILGALLGLVLAAPLLAVFALAVRLEGGPGVIFRQERVGLGGATFTLLKLRSLRPVGAEGDTTWSIAHDDRIGPVGRLIRKTSIDELPQLWNVLRGDMSLVGPRPERPHFADQFARTIPGYAERHRVVPGLTGLAVTKGLRGDTSITERARFDNLYIDTWNLALDIKILFQTVRQVATGA